MLFSRIGITHNLQARGQDNGDRGQPLYSAEDIRKVFAKSKLRLSGGAWDWITALANMPEVGGLRAANNVVRMAEYVASREERTVHVITVEMLLQASRNLKGLDRARNIARRIKRRQEIA